VSLLRKKSHKLEKATAMKLKQNFIIALTLSLLFGLGWGVGLVATTSIPVPAISYLLQAIFILLTSFQGLLIFIMHCVRSEDARKQWKIWVHIITCRKVSIETKKSITGYTSSDYGKGTLGKYNKYATMSTSAHPSGSQTLQRILKKELNSSVTSQADSVIENEYSTFSPTLDPTEEEKVDLSSDAPPKPVQSDVLASKNPFSSNGNEYIEVNLDTCEDGIEMEDFKVDVHKKESDIHSLHSVKISGDSKIDTKSLGGEADNIINKFDILWMKEGSLANSRSSLQTDEKKSKQNGLEDVTANLPSGSSLVKNGSLANSHSSLHTDEKRKSKQSGLEVGVIANLASSSSPGEETPASAASKTTTPGTDLASHKNSPASDGESSSPVLASSEKMPLIQLSPDAAVGIPDEDGSDKITIL